jgi:hypothetical protein
MTSSTAVLQVHHREAFEHTVTRVLAAGALAGAAHLLLARVGLLLPLSYLAVAAGLCAAARGDRLDRALVAGLGLLLPALPFALELAPGWAEAFAAAAGGALLVRAHVNGLAAQGELGGQRPSLGQYLLGAALAAGLVLAALAVAEPLARRLQQLDAPALLPAALSGATVGLFLGLSALAAHLGLTPDPVEARCESLLGGLHGELHTLASRALGLYRHCRQLLSRLAREPAQEELARSLGALTRECVELAAAWTGVEAQQEVAARDELAAEAAELRRRAEESRDALARSQLLLGAEALQDEHQRLSDWQLQRERLIARLRAQVALLSRTRGALLSVRSGQVQLRAAELEALRLRLRGLTTTQQLEAEALDAACGVTPMRSLSS